MGKIIFLIMSEYRELTEQEQQRAVEQRKERTSAEREAYRLLPDKMKACVERNSPVPFEGHKAFYPDMIFWDAKIIIEINGSIHRKYEQMRIDAHKDGVFREHGFNIIRILNEDICVNVAFWLRLKEKMEEIEPVGIKAVVLDYIEELDDCLSNFSKQCLRCDETVEDYSYFPKNQWKHLWQIRARHELCVCM